MSREIVSMLVVFSLFAQAQAREWSNSTGHYHLEAEMVARDDTMVVLEKGNKDLVAIAIAQLSKKDQEYLKKKEEESQKNPALQTWTTRRGLTIRGAVVEYAQRDIVIRRRRGKTYINDKRFDNLPGIYRKMVPRIVSHFEENVDIETEKQFRDWARRLAGRTKKYTVQGVFLEFENGDLYGVPFFFFSEKDLKVLKPGWDDWLKAAEDDEMRQQYALSLQAEAVANRRNEEEQRQVQLLQLQLAGYQAGLFALWEVALFPPQGVAGMPVRVVVPGRDSRQAMVAAKAQYPNYRVGPAVKVSRK